MKGFLFRGYVFYIVITHMNLLLFSAHSLSFGVYAEQVEALLKADTIPPGSEKADSACTISYKGRDIRVIDFSYHLGLTGTSGSYGDGPRLPEDGLAKRQEEDSAFVSSSKVLIVRHRKKGYIGIHVENPKKLLTISINQIHALPMIIEKNKHIESLWGIALIDERPVMLIDLEQF